MTAGKASACSTAPRATSWPTTDGQIQLEAHSVSAGLDYPGVGPEHSWLRDQGRVKYFSVTDAEALAGFGLLARTEGILPALETSHAIGLLPRLREELGDGATVLVNLSGRGDKDLQTVLSAHGDG